MKVKCDHRSKFSNLSNWKEEAWKKSGLQRDSNPWPPRYRCDALSTELWSHTLGARSIYWVHIFPCSEMMWSLFHCTGRTREELSLPKPINTNYLKRSSSYSGVCFWNNLPQDLKALVPLGSLNGVLRRYLRYRIQTRQSRKTDVMSFSFYL